MAGEVLLRTIYLKASPCNITDTFLHCLRLLRPRSNNMDRVEPYLDSIEAQGLHAGGGGA